MRMKRIGGLVIVFLIHLGSQINSMFKDYDFIKIALKSPNDRVCKNSFLSPTPFWSQILPKNNQCQEIPMKSS